MIEGSIFDEIDDTLIEKYGSEEKLLQQCDNQPALVNLVLEEFQKTGINLEEKVCAQIEEGLSFCSEAKSQCDQIGNPEFGPQFGDEEKPFIPTCPPDESQWKQMCVQRMQSEFDRMSAERLEETEYRCQEEWSYRPPADEACLNGKPRGNPSCDKGQWIAQCVQNQPPEGDYGPGPQPYGPPQGQPYGPPQGQPYGPSYQPPQNVQCPPEDPNAKQQCLNNGQSYTSQTGPNGCPMIVCQGTPQPVITPPPATLCPPFDENGKNACLQRGEGWGWSQQVDGNGCPYYQCLEPPAATATAAPTTEATAQPSATAEATASVTAGGYSELRLEDIPYGGQQGGYGGGPGPYGGPQGGPGFGGYGQPNMQKPLSASERCEQEWSRNEPRFTAQCQRDSQRNKGPMFNFCNEQEFIAQCKAESEKQMQREKERMNPERICEQQVKRDIKHFERYCKDTTRGKEQCLKESEKGCEFGKKQLARCKELVQPDSVKKAIEKAVARECRVRNGPQGPGRYGNLDGYVSDDYKPVIDYVSDDLSESDQTLSEAERKERDLLYQLFRTNKDNVEQAKKFKESKEKLDASIKNLESLRESVSEDKRGQFDEEIANIKKRRDEAEQSAKDLEKGSEGILSFLTKLFGG